MRYDSFDEMNFKIWKKRLLAGGFLILGLGLVGCGAGAYGLYQLGKNVTANFEVGTLTDALPKASQIPTLGAVGGTVLAIASDWASASIADGDIQSVRHGVACIEALGGPDAGHLLATLAKHTNNSEIAQTMRRVASELTKNQESRPASCISLLAG